MLLALECDHADSSLPQSSLFYLLLLGHCIYLDLVRPLVEYASTVWNPYRKTEINKTEAVQRRAARYVVSNQRNDLVSDLSGVNTTGFYLKCPVVCISRASTRWY
jgi:hypothetical protein